MATATQKNLVLPTSEMYAEAIAALADAIDKIHPLAKELRRFRDWVQDPSEFDESEMPKSTYAIVGELWAFVDNAQSYFDEMGEYFEEVKAGVDDLNYLRINQEGGLGNA
jgi:hypothetical protein